ncbi:putative gustatory receptor 59b [Cochliomyia hominivorax]
MFNIKYIYSKICQYFSICVGATSYLHDENTNNFYQTLITRWVAGVSNVYALIILLYVFHASMKVFEPAPHVHPLLKIMTRINLTFRIVAIYYTVLHRNWRERSEIPLRRQLKTIKSLYFVKHKRNKEIDKQFRILFYVKYFIVFHIYLNTFVLNFWFPFSSFQWLNWILFLCNATILNVLYTVMFGFYKMILNICHMLYYLNYQLEKIYEQLKSSPTTHKLLTEEFQTIWKIHGELCVILQKYLSLYQFQLITNRFFSVTNNIVNAYFGYVFIFYYPSDLSYLIFGGFSYFIYTSDLYLNDYIYELVGESFKQLITIMQKFNLTNSLYKECEEFSIYFCSRKEILCDVELNLAAWFKIMTNLLTSAIILIQSHLGIINIFKKHHLEIY